MGELTDHDASRILDRLSDRWWRLNNLYYIVDKYGRKVLFKPNDVQAELDDNLHNLNLVLKSRQHGITTWACIRALDLCLFRPNAMAGIVAHTAGDAGKFFRKKVLYAYDNLPDWLKQHRRAVRRDMNAGILELSNGSSVEVSVSHRGGTLQFLHISEYGPMCAMFPERAGEVASGALNAIAPGNIVVIESTAYGASGDFYDRSETAMELDKLVRAGTEKLTVMDYKFHFFGWFQDPINWMEPDGVTITDEDAKYFAKIEGEMGVKLSPGQKAWYVKKAGEQRDKMLREHPSTPEEAFEASTDGAYYGREMAAAAEEGRICDLPIDPSKPVHTFWDIGRSDTTAIWFMQENGPWFDFIDFYEASGHQVAHFAKVLRERGYVYGKHYWPHDGQNTDWSAGEGKTRKQVAEGLGIKPIKIGERIDDITHGIDMVRQVLPRCRFDKKRCGPPRAGQGKGKGGLEAMRRYHKEWHEKTQSFSDHPKHDWASNPADGFRTFAQDYKSSTGRAVATKPAHNESWRTA
ncbi:MAG: DNA packaging protein [Lysobacter sp.]